MPLLASSTAWVPFLSPAPIWDAWPILLLPLLVGISVAYKAMKVPTASRLLPEALKLTLYLTLGLIGAAVALTVLVGFVL